MHLFKIIFGVLVLIGLAHPAPLALPVRGSFVGRGQKSGGGSGGNAQQQQVRTWLDGIRAEFEKCNSLANNRLRAPKTALLFRREQQATVQRCRDAYQAAVAGARRHVLPPPASKTIATAPASAHADGGGAQRHGNTPAVKRKSWQAEPADAMIASSRIGPVSMQPGHCMSPENNRYTVKRQRQISGKEDQALLACQGHCGIATDFSYGVDVTVTDGVSIDLSKVVGVGLNTEVSRTTAKGTTNGAEISCEGPWYCALLVTPKLLEVTGEKQRYDVCTGKNLGLPKPFTVWFPIVRSGTLKVTLRGCACPNYPHATDPRAPPLCPKDC